MNRLEASRRLLASQVEVLTLQVKTLVGLGPEAPCCCEAICVPPCASGPPGGVDEARGAVRPGGPSRGGDGRGHDPEGESRRPLGRQCGRRHAAGFWLRPARPHGEWEHPAHPGRLSLRRGERLGHAARTQSEPGNIAAALASTTAAQRRLALVTLTIRQEVTAAFTQYDAAQRALEITRRASGRSPVRTSRSSARPIRWDAPPCWT